MYLESFLKEGKFWKNSENLLNRREEALRKSLSEDLRKYPSKKQIKDLKPQHQKKIEDYDSNLIGTNALQALEIAKIVNKGVSKNNLCSIFPVYCAQNKGISRKDMPQVEGNKSFFDLAKSKKISDRKKAKAMLQAGADIKDDRPILDQLLEYLSNNGVRRVKTRISVGALRATQKEIKAEKAFGMADSYLKEEFPGLDQRIIISNDDYILDGHHRWAALLLISPKRKIIVERVDMEMDDLLKEAAAFPGVYKADLEGNPFSAK